ncbi:uncharacterized protein LOC111022111 [Momordica charantia]|uniref:Uncharacterized protein LOC111022111 n=1 Tax=Momordica charantia TaxID=3673 RepID=A0A6J1DQA2_MOMCH|nr:uncharacterized protein LOC111022111 [Momordica charantia]
MSSFLGIEVSYPKTGGLFLSQAKYVTDLLHKTKIHEANALSSPMISGSIVSAFHGDPFHDVFLYRSTVGALQYVTITRPELTYSVNKVSQFMHAPTLTHWQAVKRILHYLAGSFDHGLLLSPPSDLSLQGFADSDWASDPDDRHSTSGFCIQFGGNLVSWTSKKQVVVSRSSTEAEYRSLAHAAADLIWIQILLSELRLSLPQPPILWCDNLSAVHFSVNLVLHSRAKHVEIDIYFVRNLVLQYKLRVTHIPTATQIVDILTKSLSAAHWNISRIDTLKKQLSKSFAMKDLGPAKKILGIHIARDKASKKLYMS